MIAGIVGFVLGMAFTLVLAYLICGEEEYEKYREDRIRRKRIEEQSDLE